MKICPDRECILCRKYIAAVRARSVRTRSERPKEFTQGAGGGRARYARQAQCEESRRVLNALPQRRARPVLASHAPDPRTLRDAYCRAPLLLTPERLHVPKTMRLRGSLSQHVATPALPTSDTESTKKVTTIQRARKWTVATGGKGSRPVYGRRSCPPRAAVGQYLAVAVPICLPPSG